MAIVRIPNSTIATAMPSGMRLPRDAGDRLDAHSNGQQDRYGADSDAAHHRRPQNPACRSPLPRRRTGKSPAARQQST